MEGLCPSTPPKGIIPFGNLNALFFNKLKNKDSNYYKIFNLEDKNILPKDKKERKMIVTIMVYACILCVISYYAVGRRAESAAFFVNNRQSGTFAVAFSIVASCVGGSATMGMAGLAWNVGFPAFWWLGTGAIGLCILAIFLAKRVRESGASTLPEMVTTFIGAPARPLSSIIIILAWLAITAAQFSAMATLLAPVLTSSFGIEADMARSLGLVFGAVLVTLYACIGGQAAIIKSDVIQFLVLMFAFAVAFIFLWQDNSGALLSAPFEVLNKDFALSKFSYFLLILGGSYVVCPMLFGRLLSARSATVAKRGAFVAVIGLVLSAMLIVSLGILCRGLVPTVGEGTLPESVLTTVLFSKLPEWASMLVLLGIFSALISSADSSLVTGATILSNDILRSLRPSVCRVCILCMGLGAVLLAMPGKGILALLLMANDIYVCGVVVPVFVGMLAYKKRPVHVGFMSLAMAVGGGFGLMAALSENTTYAYAGLGAGLLLSLCALFVERKEKAFEKSFE